MKLAVLILEDVLTIRPVTDSCYESSVKTELNEYRQEELPEANNARRVWMRFSVIYYKLDWSKLLIWSIFLMFTVSEGNIVKRMEDIFWKKNRIYALSKNIFFTKKTKGKSFGFLLNLQTLDIFSSLQKASK